MFLNTPRHTKCCRMKISLLTHIHTYTHTQTCTHTHTHTQTTHCKNKIVKITNLLVSTVARNNLNCNLICRVGCYGYTVMIIE